MKKALLAALCLIIAGLMMMNGTFALPSLEDIFQTVSELIDKATPQDGGDNVKVALVLSDEPNSLYPGSTVSRTCKVKNEGDQSVYFRIACAIQYDEATWGQLGISFEHDDKFTATSGWKDITIGTTPYRMKVFTYKEALTENTTSDGVEISISMGTSVTSEQLAKYRADFLQIQALAIETEAFNDKDYDTAEGALNAALPLTGLNPF